MGLIPFLSPFRLSNRLPNRLQQWHHRSQKHSKRSAPPSRPLSLKRPSPSRTPSELESSSDVLSSSALRRTPRPTLTRSVSRSLASVKPKRTETSCPRRAQTRPCCPHPWYQPGLPPCQEDPSASPTQTDRKRRFCQT